MTILTSKRYPDKNYERREETLRWAQSGKRCSALPFLLGWSVSKSVRGRSARRCVWLGRNFARYCHGLRSGRADKVLRRRGDELSLS